MPRKYQSNTDLLFSSGNCILGRVCPPSPKSAPPEANRLTHIRIHRWLEHEKLKAYPQAQIILLRPSMCFMLNMTPDPLTLKEALPSFTHATHIFLPINDSRSPGVAEGGSHWSLLLVSTIDGVAFHYDSLRPSNRGNAQLAASKLSTLLGGAPLKFLDLEDSPQQDNGSDCGVYVCLQMKYLLLHRLLQRGSTEKISMSMGREEVDAARGRKEMVKLIEGFRKEGTRSHSRSRSPLGAHRHGHRHGHEHSKSPPRVGD